MKSITFYHLLIEAFVNTIAFVRANNVCDIYLSFLQRSLVFIRHLVARNTFFNALETFVSSSLEFEPAAKRLFPRTVMEKSPTNEAFYFTIPD